MTKETSERNWVLLWAVAIVLLASMPYLWGIYIAPTAYSFLGLTYNIDDGAVYLSWMRQSADGEFFIRNLFTNDPHPARAFNVLFLVMGGFAGITRIPLIWAFHLFRAALGVGVILMIWQFSKLFLEDENERRILIPLVGLSTGIGWLMSGAQAPTGSVDMWQPEAITFLSIYLNPLFLASLILMLSSLYFLTLAHRTGRPACAIYAGLSVLLLGNIHTYDVLTVACIWTAFLLVTIIAERKFPGRTVLLSLLAALIAAPSIAYQLYLLGTDEIFRARADTPILSPVIYSFFSGYGLILVGGIVGAYFAIRARSLSSGKLLLVTWSVIGFAVPYIPVAQQRKLIMGLHIPLCILCAYGLAHLLTRLPRSVARGVFLAFILFTAGSNVTFLTRDMNLLSVGTTATGFPPYMSHAELAAMDYLRADGTPDDTVFAPPAFALFTPAFTGHQVYYGHWSETPDYYGRLGRIQKWFAFVDARTADWARLAILRETGASYYVGVGDETLPPPDFMHSHLQSVFEDGDVTIFRVKPMP